VLVADVLSLRGGPGERLTVETPEAESAWSTPMSSVAVRGRLPDLARWLTGRGHSGLVTADGSELPVLRPWL
jgi:hypothetical protein